MGTVLTVNPAGGQGFEGGGEPLTAEQAATAAAVPNVSTVVGTKALRLRNADAAAAQTGRRAGRPRQPGRTRRAVRHHRDHQPHGRRRRRHARRPQPGRRPAQRERHGTAAPAFSLPITATGIGAEVDSTGKALE